MLTTRIRITSTISSRQIQGRFLHKSLPALQAGREGADGAISQGHVTSSSQSAQHDPHSQAARSGINKKETGSDSKSSPTPIDAASNASIPKAAGAGKGNPEGLGFAEQVGSASSTGNADADMATRGSSKNGSTEATSASMMGAVKQMFGFGEEKKGKGSGAGVTGTGTLPQSPKPKPGVGRFHTSSIAQAKPTLGQAPEASKETKEDLLGDQNEHLSHKKPEESDSGKGNAAETPELPSHRHDQEKRSEDNAKPFPSGARS